MCSFPTNDPAEYTFNKLERRKDVHNHHMTNHNTPSGCGALIQCSPVLLIHLIYNKESNKVKVLAGALGMRTRLLELHFLSFVTTKVKSNSRQQIRGSRDDYCPTLFVQPATSSQRNDPPTTETQKLKCADITK